MSNDQQRHSNSKGIRSYMLRRFAQLFALLLFLLFLQCHFTAIRDSSFMKNTLEVLRTYKNSQRREHEPLHVLLLAYARTGSSFVGDLMQSLPNTFYHFEPIHFIRGSVLNDSFDEARNLLGNLFLCNISQIEGLLSWHKNHKSYMKLTRNIRYWKECSKNNSCYDGAYIDNFCRNQTTVIAKTIRLNLLEASKLFITHPHLNLKIIYLARDPRGTMNSRTKKPVNLWCKQDAMCSNSSHFCSALGADVATACSLSLKRPQDFMVIRYEDISIDPYRVTETLVKFLGFDTIPEDVKKFLRTHTYFVGNVRRRSKSDGLEYPYTTFRNSSVTAMNWRKEMSFKRVKELQNTCKQFLDAFGYYSYRTVQILRANNEMNKDLQSALKSTCTLLST